MNMLQRWLLAGIAAGAASATQGEPVTYVLDPAASFVHWEVLHFGTSTSRGRFGPVDGEVVLDRAAGRGSVGLRIATAGVDTGLRPFNARLRESDLLASEAHPTAYFVATTFRFDGERLAEVRGEFTLRGVSQPLSLLAQRFGCRREADAEICGGDFDAHIERSDFGMSYGLPWIANRVQLRVQVQGRRRAAGAP